MKYSITLFFFTGILLACYQISYSQQVGLPPPIGLDLAKKASPWHDDQIKRKTRKYKRNIEKYEYTVYLKDGSVQKANSKIFIDPLSKTRFVYYSIADSLRKITPEETLKITRYHPFDAFTDIIGIPQGNRWRFTVIDGKIKGFSHFDHTSDITEIEFEGKLIPVESPVFEQLLIGDKKAQKAFLSKNYYKAIKIYNRHYK